MAAPGPQDRALSATVLVVEDEADIRELVRYNLRRAGYAVREAADGESALNMLLEAPPDALVLDLMLPGMGGLELCRVLRGRPAMAGLPILMLTARGEDADVVAGLETGADDYLTKPFSPQVLVARVGALLRRAAPSVGESGGRDDGAAGAVAPLIVGPLELHPGRHEVRVEGATVQLTLSEFTILQKMMQRPGWVWNRQQLIDALHGEAYYVTDRTVDVQIVGLRKKLGGAAALVETVRGVGYRLRAGEGV